MNVVPQNRRSDQLSLKLAAVSGFRADILVASLMALVLIALTMLWFSFDHRIPTQDECVHIMNSLAYRELFIHCRPWQHHWWYQCFTVAPFYPPVTYIINGVILLIFGESRLVEQGCVAFYSGLMAVSIYAVCRLLNGGRIAACAAGIFLSSYPLIAWLGHTFFLDFPAVAMTAFALMVVLWWRNSPPQPDWKRTIASGMALGAGCLSKQMVPAYVAPIVLYFLLLDLTAALRLQFFSGGRAAWLKHTIAVLAIPAFVSAPYICVNYQTYKTWLSTNVAEFAGVGIHHSFVGNAAFYIGILPMVMSTGLVAVFLLSAIFFRRRDYQNLLPVIVSGVGGFCLTCTSMGIDNEVRYVVPFLIAPAIFSGFLAEKLVSSTNSIRKVLGYATLVLAVATNVSFNFMPYPIPSKGLPWVTGWWGKTDGNPARNADWGFPLILLTIEQTDAGKPVTLNVVPNHDALHVSALKLFFHEQKNFTIFPTNSRHWTIVGDAVTFDPVAACYPLWYLRKTGDNGFHVAERSKRDYEQLENFISSSGKYKLMAKKLLPDGSDLLLYRRTF